MNIGKVHEIPIEREMKEAYLTYAMSVIVARALPDVRDGLKPVQRRILYAMYDMGLTPGKPYKKSARIVGEVLGKYHPHGDAAVYDAMVRMAQDFSLRYPLVDGQGNFGSVDGDNPAAMRYTEARLSPIAMEMLRDINEDTVDFIPNFDGTLQEPAVLPGAFPNLIVNGAAGIAVGMSTNIPPHNLNEVVDALVHLIDHWQHLEDVTTSDLMQYIPGPDFPTGGVIYRYAEEKGEVVDRIARIYATGKGRFTVQARVHTEPMKGNRQRIVVTEVPYQTSKARITERIAELVREGRLEGISDVRDESDRTGMRLVIELQRGIAPEDVLPKLYKFTPMQQTFGAQLLALVDGEPRVLPLKRILTLFIEHRQDVIRRRSEFRLAKARHRAHILEGLLKALDDLDAVIRIIRRSRTVDTARQNLMKRLKVTEIQAQAILDMPLKRLAQLERRALADEYKEVRATIAYLEDLLAHPEKILGVIRDELLDIRERFGDARRTQIVERTVAALTAQDLLPAVPLAIAITRDRDIVALPLDSRRRGTAPGRKSEAPLAFTTGTARDVIYIFTQEGVAVRLPAHQIPQEPIALTSLVQVQGDVAALLALPATVEEGNVLLATARGRVKRVAVTELVKSAHKPVVVMAVEEGDRLVSAVYQQRPGDILLFTKQSQAIRFSDEEVRIMGLSAAGVLGIKLAEEDLVVRAALAEEEQSVVVITTTGHGKRMALADFPRQKRYGSGVVLVRLGKSHGQVADAVLVQGDEEIFAVTQKGNVHYLRWEDIPSGKRGTAPRPLLTTKARDEVSHLIVIPPATRGGPSSQRKQTKKVRSKTTTAPATTKGKKKVSAKVAEEPSQAATASTKAKTASKRKSTAKSKEPAKATASSKQGQRRKKATVQETAAEVQALPDQPSTKAGKPTPGEAAVALKRKKTTTRSTKRKTKKRIPKSVK